MALHKNLTWIATVGLLISGNALATVIHTDQASFDALAGASIVDGYEDQAYRSGDIFNWGVVHGLSDASMSAVLGETDYITSTSSGNIIVVNGNSAYAYGVQGLSNLDFSNSSLSTGDGVFGVGFDIIGHSGQPSIDVSVLFGDGSSMVASISTASDYSQQYFGITSELTIRGLEINAAQGGSIEYFIIDNLTLASQNNVPQKTGSPASVVPEPGTLLLLGIGLAGLGYRRSKV